MRRAGHHAASSPHAEEALREMMITEEVERLEADRR
jgi:hypothetical protein